MNRVYIVQGTSGLYSEDSDTWEVVAFSTKQRAVTWCERANAWAKDHGVAGSGSYLSLEARSENLDNPYDPNMRLIDSGVTYTFQSVPFGPRLPRASA